MASYEDDMERLKALYGQQMMQQAQLSNVNRDRARAEGLADQDVLAAALRGGSSPANALLGGFNAIVNNRTQDHAIRQADQRALGLAQQMGDTDWQQREIGLRQAREQEQAAGAAKAAAAQQKQANWQATHDIAKSKQGLMQAREARAAQKWALEQERMAGDGGQYGDMRLTEKPREIISSTPTTIRQADQLIGQLQKNPSLVDPVGYGGTLVGSAAETLQRSGMGALNNLIPGKGNQETVEEATVFMDQVEGTLIAPFLKAYYGGNASNIDMDKAVRAFRENMGGSPEAQLEKMVSMRNFLATRGVDTANAYARAGTRDAQLSIEDSFEGVFQRDESGRYVAEPIDPGQIEGLVGEVFGSDGPPVREGQTLGLQGAQLEKLPPAVQQLYSSGSDEARKEIEEKWKTLYGTGATTGGGY